MTARERLRADLARYYRYQSDPGSRLQRLKTVLETEAIWAIALYRFGQYLQEEASRPLRLLLRVPYVMAAKTLGMMIGIHLYPTTQIGPGLYIGHYGGIWISPYVRMGANCSISQEVTIGTAERSRRASPVLGDRIWVGPNTTISGRVRVESGAVVAANSLVASNIPENAVVVGVPARVIGYGGSSKLLYLPAETAAASPRVDSEDAESDPGAEDLA